MEYIFTTRMMVRDYECDIEGIVNNANYLHYTEHTRHLFLKECGLSFAEMQYKTPLRCDDEFISCLNLKKEGLRYVFYQDIYRASDNKICFKGVIDLVCLVNGKLANSKEYDEAFSRWL